MCGIAGVLMPAVHGGQGAGVREWLHQRVTAMTAALEHRGPDGQGIWLDPDAGIALGHRRLAILDPSAAGAQPMVSERFVLSFNGEIYNHLSLRRCLSGRFRSGSDTETLLRSIEQWGIETTLVQLDGMFAFAAWDRVAGTLWLARDRMGEKPLCYTWVSGPNGLRAFAFASELRALETLPELDRTIDAAATEEFLHRGFIGAPRSIYREVAKLPAAHFLAAGGEPRRYWSIPSPARFTGSYEEAEYALEHALREAASSRLLSDVPVGTFLSGGIDSSLLAAFGNGVRTFTMATDDATLDESQHALRIARHLGLTHSELRVTGADALAIVPSLAQIYDEPFADSSSIPTVLLSRLARESVKVALSGDGGDELFAGYPRYEQLAAAARLPHALRSVGASVASISRHEKAQLLAQALAGRDLAAMYNAVMGGGAGAGQPPADPFDWMARHDLENYLADDLLVKLDRASMSAGLETRLPLLAPNVVELALSFPTAIRRRKQILRDVLAKHVPLELFDRPKRGFMVPIAQWLRGPLREWANDICPGISAELPPGRRCVRVWSRLMLQSWLDARGLRQVDAAPATATAEEFASSHRR